MRTHGCRGSGSMSLCEMIYHISKPKLSDIRDFKILVPLIGGPDDRFVVSTLSSFDVPQDMRQAVPRKSEFSDGELACTKSRDGSYRA